jgi:hypothetical protein
MGKNDHRATEARDSSVVKLISTAAPQDVNEAGEDLSLAKSKLQHHILAFPANHFKMHQDPRSSLQSTFVCFICQVMVVISEISGILLA